MPAEDTDKVEIENVNTHLSLDYSQLMSGFARDDKQVCEVQIVYKL